QNKCVCIMARMKERKYSRKIIKILIMSVCRWREKNQQLWVSTAGAMFGPAVSPQMCVCVCVFFSAWCSGLPSRLRCVCVCVCVRESVYVCVSGTRVG